MYSQYRHLDKMMITKQLSNAFFSFFVYICMSFFYPYVIVNVTLYANI